MLWCLLPGHRMILVSINHDDIWKYFLDKKKRLINFDWLYHCNVIEYIWCWALSEADCSCIIFRCHIICPITWFSVCHLISTQPKCMPLTPKKFPSNLTPILQTLLTCNTWTENNRWKLITDTPRTRGGPGGCDRTLAVKRRKTARKITFFRKKKL